MKKRLSNEKIIAALIDKGSIKEAAEFLGCQQRTLYERMKKADFKEMYNEAKKEILKSATAKLQSQLGGAVDTLVNIMNDESVAAQTRVNSAVNIIQYAQKFTETVELLESVHEIEKAQALTEILFTNRR